MSYGPHTDNGVDGPDIIPDPAADHVADYLSKRMAGAIAELPQNFGPAHLMAACALAAIECAKEAYWVGRADEKAGRPETDAPAPA